MIPIMTAVVAVRRQDREYLIKSLIDITSLKHAEKAVIKAKEAAEATSFAKSESLATNGQRRCTAKLPRWTNATLYSAQLRIREVCLVGVVSPQVPRLLQSL